MGDSLATIDMVRKLGGYVPIDGRLAVSVPAINTQT